MLIYNKMELVSIYIKDIKERITPNQVIVYKHLNPILVEEIKYHMWSGQFLKIRQVIIWQCCQEE